MPNNIKIDCDIRGNKNCPAFDQPIQYKTDIKNRLREATVQMKRMEKRLCHFLIHHTLHQNYIFVETEPKRMPVTTNETWNAIECVPNKRNGDFILKGEDETDFDIEAIIEGRYEQIATVKYTYGSEVHIRKDGILVGRSFDATLDAKSIAPFNKNARGNNFNKPKSFIDDKIKEMIKLRTDKKA